MVALFLILLLAAAGRSSQGGPRPVALPDWSEPAAARRVAQWLVREAGHNFERQISALQHLMPLYGANCQPGSMSRVFGRLLSEKGGAPIPADYQDWSRDSDPMVRWIADATAYAHARFCAAGAPWAEDWNPGRTMPPL